MAKKLSLEDLKGVVFSTDPDYQSEEEQEDLEPALENKQQKLYVSLDKKQRAGKKVTIIEGFLGHEEDLKQLGKDLKKLCGVGGSVKNEIIMLQGDFRDKVIVHLQKYGYGVKKKGG